METKEISVFKGQISRLEKQANEIVIENKEQNLVAIEISSKLEEISSKVKEQKELITKPASETLKNARKFFQPIEDQYENAQKIINDKILAYTKKIRQEAIEQENKIAEKIESGKIRLETAERKIEKIERIDNTIKSDIGSVQIRKNKKVKITNELLIPREYLEPNLVAIRRDALGGKSIPGVEVIEEESLANIRN